MKDTILITGPQRADQIKSLIEKADEKKGHLINIIETFTSRDTVTDWLESTEKVPEVAIVSYSTPSANGTSSVALLLSIKRAFPSIQIIYLAGEYDPTDKAQANDLDMIIRNDIFDLIFGTRFSPTEILDHIGSPSSLSDVEKFIQNNCIEADPSSGVISNLISCYSVKPGSGKSFLALNLAVAIARFGQTKKSGAAPKVALIDGDLSSLSLGGLTGVSNDKYNIQSALTYASKVIDENGNECGTREALRTAKEEIRKCFIQSPMSPNLYVLVANSYPIEKMVTVNPKQYAFLLKCIYGAFDVVIADMQSSLEHVTTGPLFQMSRLIYFLIDPDFNNILNNIQYKQDLISLSLKNKVRYVMNKYISPSAQFQFAQNLAYSVQDVREAGLDIIGFIPYIDPIIMNNRIESCTPIVLDKKKETEAARKAILSLANETWKINDRVVADYQGVPRPTVIPKETESSDFKRKAASVKKGLTGLFKKNEK